MFLSNDKSAKAFGHYLTIVMREDSARASLGTHPAVVHNIDVMEMVWGG